MSGMLRRGASRVTGRVLLALIVAVVALATALWSAPAAWIDAAVDRASGGRVRLAEASGSVWQGSARLVWADTGESAQTRASLAGVALPGRVHWRLSALPLALGLIDASLRIDGMPQAVSLQGSFRELRIANGQLLLPQMELGALGSPWNTVRPAGAVSITWNNVTVAAQRFDGTAVIELREIASALSPVRPLGNYRIEIQGRGAEAELVMSTLDGALMLAGRGVMSARGFRFVAEASPSSPGDNRLLGLLGLIGQREGSKTIIKIGA